MKNNYKSLNICNQLCSDATRLENYRHPRLHEICVLFVPPWVRNGSH